MMKEAAKNPNVMMDAMKDLEDPENQAEVQRMMQDPSFRKYDAATKKQSCLETFIFSAQGSFTSIDLMNECHLQALRLSAIRRR